MKYTPIALPSLPTLTGQWPESATLHQEKHQHQAAQPERAARRDFEACTSYTYTYHQQSHRPSFFKCSPSPQNTLDEERDRATPTSIRSNRATRLPTYWPATHLHHHPVTKITSTIDPIDPHRGYCHPPSPHHGFHAATTAWRQSHIPGSSPEPMVPGIFAGHLPGLLSTSHVHCHALALLLTCANSAIHPGKVSRCARLGT